jgi:transcriptional regulator with XRE-family HTH domain
MPISLQQTARFQIKRWIASTGITQTTLGERIRRNQAWMSRYLGGDIDADVDTLQQIAEVFGHTLAQLLDIPDDPHEASLLAEYRALRAEVRPLAIQVLREMARGRGASPRGPGRSRG